MIAVFRVDASASIGSGHIVRCITMAKLLNERGWIVKIACKLSSYNIIKILVPDASYKIIILTGDDISQISKLKSLSKNDVDLLVVDSYDIDSRFETLCRPWAKCIMAIDDLANRKHNIDILLDQTYGRKEKDYSGLLSNNCHTILGSNYALLRPEFHQIRDRVLSRRSSNTRSMVKNILISIGSSDPYNITLKVLRSIKLLKINVNIVVVLGSCAPYLNTIREYAQCNTQIKLLVDVNNMANLMSDADMAIGAGGVSSLERCCLGLPSLTIVTAKNQVSLAKNLLENKCHTVVSFSNKLDSYKITLGIEELYKNYRLRISMSKNSPKVCDGKGGARVVKAVDDMCKKSV
jgi:UDP-2,4-diacetamido-2,4,6-trideoxy-beta-L-altropyranose hydrolase